MIKDNSMKADLNHVKTELAMELEIAKEECEFYRKSIINCSRREEIECEECWKFNICDAVNNMFGYINQADSIQSKLRLLEESEDIDEYEEKLRHMLTLWD